MIRVLIVDDHEFVRTGLSELLDDADGIVVVGECADGSEVPDVAPRVQPDVVLMDVQMPHVTGPDATRILLTRQPAVRVLMVSASTKSRDLAESAAAGASGYLIKGGDAQALVDAVRAVADGGTVWPDDPAAVTFRPAQAPTAGDHVDTDLSGDSWAAT